MNSIIDLILKNNELEQRRTIYKQLVKDIKKRHGKVYYYMTYRMTKLFHMSSTCQDESTNQGLGIAKNYNQNALDYFNKTKCEDAEEHPKKDKVGDLEDKIINQ